MIPPSCKSGQRNICISLAMKATGEKMTPRRMPLEMLNDSESFKLLTRFLILTQPDATLNIEWIILRNLIDTLNCQRASSRNS